MSKPVQLDVRHLMCPMPVIRTQEQVQVLMPGDELEVLCSDPGAATDIPTWCRISGHEVLSVEEQDWELRIRVRVGPRDDRD